MDAEYQPLLEDDLAAARFTALVALEDPIKPVGGRLVRQLKKRFQQSTANLGIAKHDDGETPSFVIPWGDMIVAVVAMPFAIPAETLRHALGNELIWKEAGEKFSGSKAHLIVSVLGGGTDFQSSRLKAYRLTAAVSSLCETEKVLGVYWSASDSVLEPARVVTEAKKSSEISPPADLWQALRFFPGHVTENHIVCRTSGLVPFAGREIECGPVAIEPRDLAGLVLGIGRYIVHSGAQFEDGATISDGRTAIGTIHHEKSAISGVETPVLKLKLAGPV